MLEPEEKRIEITLNAIERVMRMFRAERIIYLAGATAGMGLFLYAVFLMIQGGRYDGQFLGLVFGSGGLFGVMGGAILLLLNRTFGLVKEIVQSQSGKAPQSDA